MVVGARVRVQASVDGHTLGAEFMGATLLNTFAGINLDEDDARTICPKSVAWCVAFVIVRSNVMLVWCVCVVTVREMRLHGRFRAAHAGRPIHIVGWMWTRIDDLAETEEEISLDNVARGVIHVSAAYVLPAVAVGGDDDER
eukprot:TRINITY_DN3259_c0_g1_i2.p2 TRINITY_DN3259_c0_g1~~TRINITY_DN3259_c0_g1_i2.p2  ORF type:complete len:142 (+),score=33.06 TRINITY_DN3259_c0_g1_i2:2-427(+)